MSPKEKGKYHKAELITLRKEKTRLLNATLFSFAFSYKVLQFFVRLCCIVFKNLTSHE